MKKINVKAKHKYFSPGSQMNTASPKRMGNVKKFAFKSAPVAKVGKSKKK